RATASFEFEARITSKTSGSTAAFGGGGSASRDPSFGDVQPASATFAATKARRDADRRRIDGLLERDGKWRARRCRGGRGMLPRTLAMLARPHFRNGATEPCSSEL